MNWYSDEELIEEIKKASQDLGRVPNSKDFEKRKPNASTIRIRFGSWENALKEAGLKKDRQKVKDYTREELIKSLQKYYNEFNKVPTTRDLKNNSDYPTCETFRNHFGSHKNALIEAGLYDLRKDKGLFERHKYSKEEVITLVKSFISKYNRLPICEDFNTNKELPASSIILNIFGNLNELILLLGYEPINNSLIIRTDEEMISALQKLYLELGRTPTSRDIKVCQYTASDKVYISRFGSFYNSLEVANIPYQKRTKFLTNKEVIDIWYNIKYQLNRIPTLVEISSSEIDISHSIQMRWGGYSEFLKDIGEESNYNIYGCKTYFTSKGTKCFSLLELKLTQWLEDSEIQFEKDYPYKKLLRDDKTNRTLDWIIFHNNHKYYVELFGILNNDFYDEKTKRKIEDFKKNNIKLIELYPENIKMKQPSEIFSFLF